MQEARERDFNSVNKVCVYGTLMTGFGNNRLLSRTNSKLLGEDEIDGFDMYSLGGFPGVNKGNGTIKVEIWEVDCVETFWNLDGLEGYPYMYTRDVVPTKYGDAWIYIYNHNLSTTNKLIKVGNWKAYKQLINY